VADSASDALAATRSALRDNASALRSQVEVLARQLMSRGASDTRAPVLIRGRYCVAIKAGRQSELPKGSVKLGASQTGATQVRQARVPATGRG
jgi:DNA mismatch repair protein MutS2